MNKQWLDEFIYKMNSEVPELDEIISRADPSLEVDKEFAEEIKEGFVLKRKEEFVKTDLLIEFVILNTNISETTKPGYIQFHENLTHLDGCFEFALANERSLRQDSITKHIYLSDYSISDDVELISSNPENFISMLIEYSNLLVKSRFKGEEISTNDMANLIDLAGGEPYREGIEAVLNLD